VISLSQIAVIDLEASSLDSASFPTEIGWCLLHDDGSISTSGSCLIRPIAKWTTYAERLEPSERAIDRHHPRCWTAMACRS
jgi:hypothetical protein